MSKLHGWYSHLQAKRVGYYIYESPGGEKVWVTTVSSSPDRHRTGYSDIKYVGPVARCLSKHLRERSKHEK
jgi:hypothetical protein